MCAMAAQRPSRMQIADETKEAAMQLWKARGDEWPEDGPDRFDEELAGLATPERGLRVRLRAMRRSVGRAVRRVTHGPEPTTGASPAGPLFGAAAAPPAYPGLKDGPGATHTMAAATPPPLTGQFLETRLSREVRGLLATLGTTRRSISAALERAGVRAAPNDPARSPIALFLTAIVGADPNVKSVAVDEAEVVVQLCAWWRPAARIPLPSVVHDFMAAFDAGCYPTLLREEFREHSGGRPDSERAD